MLLEACKDLVYMFVSSSSIKGKKHSTNSLITASVCTQLDPQT